MILACPASSSQYENVFVCFITHGLNVTLAQSLILWKIRFSPLFLGSFRKVCTLDSSPPLPKLSPTSPRPTLAMAALQGKDTELELTPWTWVLPLAKWSYCPLFFYLLWVCVSLFANQLGGWTRGVCNISHLLWNIGDLYLCYFSLRDLIERKYIF